MTISYILEPDLINSKKKLNRVVQPLLIRLNLLHIQQMHNQSENNEIPGEPGILSIISFIMKKYQFQIIIEYDPFKPTIFIQNLIYIDF